MTVSTELSHEEYVGNGVTTDFDFRFRIFEGKHLIVVVADSEGNETTLKNGTDYTIVGAGSYHGGKVVLNKPLAQGWKILLERDLPVVQETDLRNQGKFFAEVHEDAFDYLTMLIQKALGTFSLSLRKPTYLSNYYDAKGNRIANLAPPKFGTDSANKDYVDNSIKDIDSKTLRVKDKPINALPNTEQRANKILAFDDNGQPITVLPESGSASDVLIELAKKDGYKKIGGITENFQLTFDTVTDLEESSLNVGDIVNTRGLRNPHDGGGATYRIIYPEGTRPESKGYKVTKYPFEYGDVRIANGNIAKRVTSVKKTDNVKIWAHRGGLREFAENTMFAFTQAIDNGAYGIELDLSMSSDGIWHVYHDASLYVLTNGTDYIYNRDSEYLRGLTFNKLRNTKYADLIKIPTFSEFLSWAKENNIQFSAEFKHPRPGMVDEDIRAGIKMIIDSGCELQSRVAVTTNMEALRVRELSNDIKLWWSVSRLTSEAISLYQDYNNLEIMLFTDNIDSNAIDVIRTFHAMNKNVISYTSLNTEDDLRKAVNAGFDQIVSDRGWENRK